MLSLIGLWQNASGKGKKMHNFVTRSDVLKKRKMEQQQI